MTTANQPHSGWGPPPVRGFGPQGSPTPTPTEGIIALVLSVSTMMTSCFPLAFIGLYFGQRSRKRGQENGDKTMETLGLISMILSGVFGGLWLLFWAMQILLPLGIVGLAFLSDAAHR